MSSKILPNLLLLLLLAPTCFSLTKEWAEVLISEVYIGNNSQEDFIELNSGSGNFSFTNFSLDINSNDSSRSFPLDGQQTNSKGFLVLSAKNNKVLMEHLREVHNVTINITLTHHTLIHHTIILRSFQTNVVICYKEVSPIQLASNLSTEGSVNNCPLSPVHIEQVSFLNDSTLAVILHSNDLPKWKLKSLEVNVTLDGNLAHSTSLDEFTTDDNETYSLSISFDSKQEQTTAVLLYFVSNTSGPIVLDGVAFGNGSKSSINLTKIWTYPYLYPPKEKAMQYIELNSNGNGMVKFFHYDLSFKLFVLVPGNTGPSKNNASTSASSPMSSTIPSSSPSTSLNTTMTTETFLSTNSTNNSSEVTTDVNATTSSNDTISTSVPYTTVTEAFNDTSTQSTENTTASNGSTITYATPTSYNTTVGHTEETTTSNNSSTDSMEMSTSNFTDVTSHDNKSTPSSTTETSDYTTTSSSPPSSQSPTETSGTVQHDVLKINEIKLDGNLPSNNWIELRSKESNSSSKYVLVWSTLDQMSNRSITFNNLITQNQSLMIIDKKKDDYSEFVKQLTIGSGVLKLQHDKSNQLVDCVSYMISDVPVAKERKAIMQNQCSKHPPVLITKRYVCLSN
ncbi:uncharacterized protein LOC106868692 [Octopus bimaculoides]|uniref:uncharacterized protein LOC106868692 n=1 Tax=Octopus bimaculoides TaxID=37653 RepID=UPI0022E826F1|nr:uncharacterized protein LOC106868692 [Octopus bimaculoides]XP_052832560.1 uncharacterized protein LOC106868692 [Octopus bimaculoides]